MKCLFLPLSIILLSGCITLPQKEDHVVYRNKPHDIKEEPVSSIPSGQLDPELIDVDQYALLSANIYDSFISNNLECINDKHRIELKKWQPLFLPDWRIHHSSDWKPLQETPKFPETPAWSIKSGTVGYEVSINHKDKIVAIVFRGTDFTEHEDWVANLRWFLRIFGFIWDQYDQVQALIPTLLNSIDAFGYGDYSIVTTGHSLGGGLAQQAAYVDKRIDKVIAFDSSVVTGFYDVDLEDREINTQGLKIYRVYEHGEVLAYLRLIMKHILPISEQNPDIIEVRYDLTKSKDPIKEHDIKEFACRLQDIAEQAKESRQ